MLSAGLVAGKYENIPNNLKNEPPMYVRNELKFMCCFLLATVYLFAVYLHD